MIPSDHFFIGGGASDTIMTPAAAMLLALAILCLFILPRKYVIVPLLLGALLVPSGEVIVVAGFHLMPVRLMAIFGWARLAMSRPAAGESRYAGGLNPIDRAVLAWGLAMAVAVAIQWMNVSALANQAGTLVGTFGMYFLLRQLIRDDEDIARAITALVIVAVLNVVSMVSEQLTLHNLFGTLIGGVQMVPLVREGKIRAQGAFQHAILAGVFGATLLPLCFWVWNKGKAQVVALVGIVAASLMTLASSSSTPVMAYGGVITALCLWPVRRKMQLLRRCLAVALICLHLVMKAPVWFLIARIDIIGGSASFDRAYLIDTCVRHFWDWWLVGTRDIGNWGWSMWDLSNQFVSIAETGGLAALVFFIAIISRGFGRLGTARKALSGNRQKEWGFWLLGAALYAHILAYFGVSYFDQTQVTWFVLLAVISAATLPALQAVKEPEPVEAVLEQPFALASPGGFEAWSR